MATSVSSSIISSLGSGSGIDIAGLVDQLVTANFQNKNSQLNSQSKTVAAEISSATSLKSDISNLASGLKTLATGGTVSTQATSSDTSIVKASAISGSTLAATSTEVEVRQLARAQTAASTPQASRTAPIGTGKLTLQFGTATTSGGAITGFTAGAGAAVDINITSGNASLDGIAAAINAANAGVTATIVSDSSGARLSLKGATGEAQAFTLTATEDAGAPGLAALNIGVGSSVGTAAQDAIVAVDGIALKRASNSISDLVAGVKLDLVAAKPGTSVTLGSSIPTDTLKQSVNDFVSAFNNLTSNVKSQTNATDGTLRGDAAARNFARALGRLTLTPLATTTTSGVPRTLAEIGVATNRDGSLTVNTAQLDAALKNYPSAVEALFANGTGSSGGGIAAAFQAIADAATDSTTGLGASIDRYTKTQSSISDQKDKLATDTTNYRNRLTKQFSSVDSKVASYKSTGSYLTQQFKTNSSNN